MPEIDKPLRSEDEYFARQEIERRKKWAEEHRAQMAEEEKVRLKEFHFMKCPKCGMDLQEIEFQGVKVDQCANCGGVFFDAGEIDSIVKKDEQGVIGKMMSIFR